MPPQRAEATKAIRSPGAGKPAQPERDQDGHDQCRQSQQRHPIQAARRQNCSSCQGRRRKAQVSAQKERRYAGAFVSARRLIGDGSALRVVAADHNAGSAQQQQQHAV